MVESFCPLHIPKIVNNCKLNGSYFLKNITKYTIVDRNGHRLGLFILFCDRLTANHTRFTDQMAEWYGASASGSVDLGFDSESGQTNDFKIGIHSFPA